MAINYYYKTPRGFSKDFDKEDWIQLAMITFFECVENYDRKQPFDHFVRFKIPRRLEDQRRKLYRQNPTTEYQDQNGEIRLFSGLSESIQRKAPANRASEPEQLYLMQEARKILLSCIQQLEKIQQILFTKHEMEKVSFQKLLKLVPDYDKSFASFKRWYTADIFTRVKRCVESQTTDS